MSAPQGIAAALARAGQRPPVTDPERLSFWVMGVMDGTGLLRTCVYERASLSLRVRFR